MQTASVLSVSESRVRSFRFPDWFGRSYDGKEATMRSSFCCFLALIAAAAAPVAAQQASSLSREQLKPLTEFRQQHRRLVSAKLATGCFCLDCFAMLPSKKNRRMAGYVRQLLCRQALAFHMEKVLGLGCPVGGCACLHRVHRRRSLSLLKRCAYVWCGCVALQAPDPEGASGREWCYIEPQAAVEVGCFIFV